MAATFSTSSGSSRERIGRAPAQEDFSSRTRRPSRLAGRTKRKLSLAAKIKRAASKELVVSQALLVVLFSSLHARHETDSRSSAIGSLRIAGGAASEKRLRKDRPFR